MKIAVETKVAAPVADVWRAWTTPDDITQWNTASPDWHCPAASLDLRAGGAFSYRMAAKDGSMAFDFSGTFTKVVPQSLIEFSLGDDRVVSVEFVPRGTDVVVRETFEAESAHAAEMQRQGWQAILDNFAQHVASKSRGRPTT
jgi:uncharacterized protein YndB with AHSA1/START domain